MRISSASNANNALELGALRLDPTSREVIVNGTRKRLRRKAMHALMLLREHEGDVVTRDELIDTVWGGRAAVSDESVTQLMSELRRVLRLDASGALSLQAISGKGYRLRLRAAATVGGDEPNGVDLVERDRGWGLALLLGVTAVAQGLALLFGGGHH